MATKKDVYYFSHDANALSDPKILSMRCDYGFESYGLYWAIIEMLRNESNFKLPLTKNTYRAIKMQTGTTIDIEQFLKDCINEYIGESGNGLFNSDGKSFWSESLLRRMEKYESIKEKRTAAANARWNKNKFANAKNKSAKQKQCKCIKGYCKSNANAYQKRYKSNAKLCKLNKIKSNQNKLNKIKLNKIKSIYPSNHKQEENKYLSQMMDKMEKMEFEKIVSNTEIVKLNPNLCIEIREILRELYMNPNTREKISGINSKNIIYALKRFSIANTKSTIQKPKAYFKQCILSAMEQTELSTQYDIDTIYELESGSD